MKYALLIYPAPGSDEELSEAQLDEVRAEFDTMTEDIQYVAGAQLQPVTTATSVRVDGGRTLVTDGPFADTKEVLGGFLMIEAANLDKALEFAARVPVIRFGAAVEVRPVVQR
jgi:hypothetical protein